MNTHHPLIDAPARPSPTSPHDRDQRRLISRIKEAERAVWLGEVDGLTISLAGAEDELQEMERLEQRFPTIHLGMPDLSRVTVATIASAEIGTEPSPCIVRPTSSAGRVLR